MEKQWYVVNTYSGHESKVKEKLEQRTVSMGMTDNIFRVIIPETTEVEVKDGVKKEKVKKEKKVKAKKEKPVKEKKVKEKKQKPVKEKKVKEKKNKKAKTEEVEKTEEQK